MTIISVLKQGVRNISQARSDGVETTKAGLVDREQIVLLQERIYHLVHCTFKDFIFEAERIVAKKFVKGKSQYMEKRFNYFCFFYSLF